LAPVAMVPVVVAPPEIVPPEIVPPEIVPPEIVPAVGHWAPAGVVLVVVLVEPNAVVVDVLDEDEVHPPGWAGLLSPSNVAYSWATAGAATAAP
jgi:hypothetical protein